MEKVFRVNLAVAFLLTAQNPHVEVALMISGLKRLINELTSCFFTFTTLNGNVKGCPVN